MRRGVAGCVVLAGSLVAIAGPVGAAAAAAADQRVVTLRACIDGLDNLHVKNGRLSWEHLAFSPPGTHVGCRGVLQVDGVHWEEWQTSFTLPVPAGGSVAFHPVQCRGNCVLVQAPSAENGGEAIYQLDDFMLPSSAVYCVRLVFGGPLETPAEQSVQHIVPAPVRAGGRPLFRGPGGQTRAEACAEELVS